MVERWREITQYFDKVMLVPIYLVLLEILKKYKYKAFFILRFPIEIKKVVELECNHKLKLLRGDNSDLLMSWPGYNCGINLV